MLFYASLSPKIASDLHVARLDEAEPAHQKVDEKCNDGRGGKMKDDDFHDKGPFCHSGSAHGCICRQWTDKARGSHSCPQRAVRHLEDHGRNRT